MNFGIKNSKFGNKVSKSRRGGKDNMKDDIKDYECTGCGRHFTKQEVRDMTLRGLMPMCPKCGNLLKANGGEDLEKD